MSVAIWISRDAPDLTEREQRLFELLCDREARSFRPLSRISRELGDRSPMAIYTTLNQLARKGLVVKSDDTLGWRVRWLHQPTVEVRFRSGAVMFPAEARGDCAAADA